MTDWKKFVKLLVKSKSFLKLKELSHDMNIDELDYAADVFLQEITNAYTKAKSERNQFIRSNRGTTPIF